MSKHKTVNAAPVRKKGRANSIDEHVGLQLRQRRSLLGYSQERLAERVGITFQQIQKYENGANRVSASRLYEFSKVLDIPVNFFFETYGSNENKAGIAGFAEGEQSPFEGQPSDIMARKETLELIRVYYSIQNPKLRKDLFKLVKSMAENMKSEDS
ncbi:MAG: helix-turn-helix transcriptional regulator [Micavibrio sp.]